jgi:hypothetical protein
VGHSKGSPKREFYSHEHPHQKITDISDNLMIHFKFLEKQEQANSKSNRWKEIIKIRAEINELDIK